MLPNIGLELVYDLEMYVGIFRLGRLESYFIRIGLGLLILGRQAHQNGHLELFLAFGLAQSLHVNKHGHVKSHKRARFILTLRVLHYLPH